MQGSCTLCSKIKVDIANEHSESSDLELQAVSQDDTYSEEDSTLTVKYYKWATIDWKVEKVAVDIDHQDANEILNEYLISVLKFGCYFLPRKQSFGK